MDSGDRIESGTGFAGMTGIETSFTISLFLILIERFSMEKSQLSIAVLVFEDMRPGEAQVYFCDSIAEEISNYLTKSAEAGFAHRQYLEKDSDFNPIHSPPHYRDLIKNLEMREKESSA